MGEMIFKDQYVKVGNTKTRYWLAGDKGSTIILLHGVGCSVEFWEKNIAALAREHRVFAVDIVGFGRTDKPDVDYTFELMADFVLDFMDEMGIERAFLVGNSMGGGITLTVAGKAPERLEKIVLVCPAGVGRSQSRIMGLMTLPVIGNLLTKPSRKGVVRQMQLCLNDPSLASNDFIDRVAAIGSIPGNQRSFLSLVRIVGNIAGIRQEIVANFTTLLNTIETPMLMIWGRQDQVLPVTEREALVKKIASIQLHIMDNAGHFPQIDKPEEFNTAVLDFLKD